MPQSLAEIGALLGVPIGVARVLVSDLAAEDHLAVHLPLVGPRTAPPPRGPRPARWMASVPAETPIPLKILIAGGFGVGKTTLVAARSRRSRRCRPSSR